MKKLTELIGKTKQISENTELKGHIENILRESLSIEVSGGDYGSGFYIVLKFNGNEISSDTLPIPSR